MEYNYKINNEKIEKLMKTQGYRSAKDWCQVNGFNSANYYMHKHGQRGFSLDTAVRYADALHIKLDDFIIYGDDLND